MFATEAINKINLKTATRDELKSAVKAYRLGSPDYMTPDLRKSDDVLKAFILSKRRSVQFVKRFLGYVRDSWMVVDEMSPHHGVAAYDILWSIDTLRVDSAVEFFIRDMHEDAILALIDAVVSQGLTGNDVARYLNTRFKGGQDHGDGVIEPIVVIESTVDAGEESTGGELDAVDASVETDSVTSEVLSAVVKEHENALNELLHEAYNYDHVVSETRLERAVKAFDRLKTVYSSMPTTVEFQAQNRALIRSASFSVSDLSDELRLLRKVVSSQELARLKSAFGM